MPLCVLCEHFIVPGTDHKAVVLELNDSDIIRGPGYWRFNNSYLKDTAFVSQMNNFLNTLLFDNDAHTDATDKWEQCKIEIREFCIEFGRQRANVKRNDLLLIQLELKLIEKQLTLEPHNTDLQTKFVQLKTKLEIMHLDEAKGAQIRSRIKWIDDGEKNTKYFCSLEKTRAKKNTITRLKPHTGEVITNQTQILEEQVNFYKGLYSQEADVQNTAAAIDEFIADANIPRLSSQEAEACEGPITLKETSKALYVMKNGSAPGCDGLTVEFMKFFWNKLGTVVTQSLDDAFERGDLSYSQKQGVIILIHKGKELPREQLTNWRPITLTNTDYKIIAKVLALRLSLVIQTIINEDQVGYLKGRNICSVLRTIDDVIDYCNQTGKGGYLLAQDTSKAFDSISKQFLLEAFNVFGFGAQFRKWVSVITSGSMSCINHAGWLSEPFKVTCGIRQGCPFSPLAYVLAVELMAIKIRHSSIKGITLPSPETESAHLKIKQLADDTTLFLQDKQDMKIAKSILDSFAGFSGLKLNVEKTKAMPLGRQIEEHDLPFKCTNKIKILGIVFQNNAMARNIEENWLGRLEKMSNLIKIWSVRDLSIHGKLVVIKTFLVSQFTFVMQSIGLPDAVLQKVNRILYKFLWQRRFCNKRAFEKVKRKILQGDYCNGGLKMVDMQLMQECYYLQWAGKLHAGNGENWTYIPKWNYSPLAKGLGVFEFNCKPEKAKMLHLIKNEFWRNVLTSYLKNKTIINSENVTEFNFYEQMLFNNNLNCYKKQTLLFSKCINNGIEKVKDLINTQERRLLTVEEVQNKIKGNTAAVIFEYNAIFNALPTSWKNWVSNGNLDYNNEQQPTLCEVSTFNTKPKNIKLILEKKSNDTILLPRANTIWQTKLGVEITEEMWIMSRKATKETRLRELQWKLLHNIYPTNILLTKMKVSESELCDYCKTHIDFTEHFFYQCELLKDFWKYVELLLSDKIGIQVVLNLQNVLFGIWNDDIFGRERNYVNHIILIAKMCISIAKKTKTIRTLQLIFDYHVMLRIGVRIGTCFGFSTLA